MADTKISALPAASALTGTEEFAVNQGGTSKKATAAQITASGPAWTAYTPTFTAATTNPTLGNFTRTGRYSQRGKTVNFVVIITCNSTTGLGTGAYEFGLPVTPRALDEVVAYAAQTGPQHAYMGRNQAAVGTLQMTHTDVLTNMTAANAGFTTGSIIRISGTYEAA